MRFSEFKIITEAPSAQFYTIGDSHAVAIAQAGGKTWVNLAIGGRSSTDSEMLSNISKLPEGAVVVVSQGANDTANSARATMDSGGKRQPVPPATIAANVANVVAKVQAQRPSKVFFMLFPNGPGRGAGLAKYYGGDYQEEVRNAIKGAVDVPIIDINGKPLTDGVHATMAVYKEVANKVTSQAGGGVTLGPAGAAPGAPATKDKEPAMRAFRADGSFYVPMLVGNKGPEVADLQKALLALGYQLPKYGVDGIVGRETKDAIRAFQTDKKLQVDGIAGKETITAVNNTITANPKVASSLKQSTQADVKARVQNVATGDAKGGAGATGSATTALKFFISKGWTTEQAAGIVGNLQAESGANLKTDAVGDAGQAYGIAQWHPPRQKDFTKTTGKDIRGSSLQDQLTFIDWELNNTERNAGRHLKAAKTAEEAAWVMDEYYERSTGAHRQNRINNAVALASTSTTTA